jgi:hypothetical protein
MLDALQPREMLRPRRGAMVSRSAHLQVRAGDFDGRHGAFYTNKGPGEIAGAFILR